MSDGRVIIDIDAEIASFLAKVREVEAETKGLAEDLDLSFEKVGSSLTEIGTNLSVAVTLPLLAAGTAAVTMAMNFEDSMAKVETIADTTQVPIEELEAAILNLSNETGIAATDIAENVYNAISAGQETGDAVAFVEQATKLATAGFTDSASALDVLTTTLNAYGMESEEVTRVSDVLLATQNQGKTTVDELSQNMGKAIPTASAFSVSLENLAAAYATTTANGISTAESTTYINSMIKELGDGSTDVGMIIQEKLGMSFAEAMDAGYSLGDALLILQEQGDETGQTMYDMFSSSEAASAAASIVGDSAVAFSENLEAMTESAGATDEAFATMQTTSYDLEIAFNQVKNTLIEAGDAILRELEPVITSLCEDVETFVEWFSELDEEGQKNVLMWLAIAAAAGPVLILVGNALTLISSLSSGLKTLNSVFASVDTVTKTLTTSTKAATSATETHTAATVKGTAAMGLAKTAAIGLAVAGLVYLASKFIEAKEEQEEFEKATDGLRDATLSMSDSIASAAQSLEDSKENAETYVKSMSEVESQVDDVIQSQVELAQAISDTFAAAGTDVAMLDSYMDTIDELTGKTDLSTQEQGELRAAVEAVNEICGTSYEVSEVTGEGYQLMADGVTVAKDEIYKLIEAQQAQIMLDAYSEHLKEAYEAQADAAVALTDATAKYNDLLATKNERVEDAIAIGGNEADALRAVNDEIIRAEDAVREATETYEASNSAVGTLTDNVALYTQAVSESSDSLLNVVVSNDLMMAAFESAGQSAGDFIDDLSAVGVSTADLSALTDEQMLAIAEAYDGTYTSINGILQGYGVDLDLAAVETALMADKNSDVLMGQIDTARVATDGTIEELVDGMTAGAEPVGTAAGKVASAAAGPLEDLQDNTGPWGSHAASNFASGLGSGLGEVSTAAASLATAVANQLGHTVPKEGVLHEGGRGEVVWGEHMVENIIEGFRNKQANLRSEILQIAQIMDMSNSFSTGSFDLGESVSLGMVADGSSYTGNTTYQTINNYYIDGIDITGDAVAAASFETFLDDVARYVKMG